MNKCPKRTKKLFKFFSIRDKHLFLITNAFYTLENSDKLDVVKSCLACTEKEVISMDKQTLIEVAEKFPRAFNPLVREYILSWKMI